MRVFVLTTGRSGSATFAAACAHIRNYSSGHETRWGLLPRIRDYPDAHIEVDNRLSWFLGTLAEQYTDAFYVHLTRDPEQVAQSLMARWRIDVPPTKRPTLRMHSSSSRPDAGIVFGFAYSMMGRWQPWPRVERLDVCREYVTLVNANIREFVKEKPHLTIAIESAKDDFGTFCQRIDAEVDLPSAKAELVTRRNLRRANRNWPA